MFKNLDKNGLELKQGQQVRVKFGHSQEEVIARVERVNDFRGNVTVTWPHENGLINNYRFAVVWPGQYKKFSLPQQDEIEIIS